MSTSGNLSNSGKTWYVDFKIFMRASGYDTESNERKVTIFLHFVGNDFCEIYQSFDVDMDTVKFEKLIELFNKHCVFQRKSYN